MSRFSVALFICSLLTTASAQAQAQAQESERGDGLAYAGGALLLAGLAADTAFWSLAETKGASSPALHLIPVLGPLLGYGDVDTLCPGGDPKHGCSLPRGMAYVGSTVYLGLELAGLTLLTLHALGGEDEAPSREGALSMPLNVQVGPEGWLLQTNLRW